MTKGYYLKKVNQNYRLPLSNLCVSAAENVQPQRREGAKETLRQKEYLPPPSTRRPNYRMPLRLLCVSAPQRFKNFHRRGAKAQSLRKESKQHINRKWPILLSLGFLFCGTSYCQIIDRQSTEEKEVLRTVMEWNKAFEANDPNAYFQFISNDLSLFVPSSPYRIDGKMDDREEFEYSLKKGWTKVGYFQEIQMQAKVYGITAVVTYYNRGTYGEGANEKTLYLKETDVLIKESGKWKIIHIHVSDSKQ